MAGELIGHKGETTILILLNGHSIKLASTFLSSNSFISAAFRLREISLWMVFYCRKLQMV